MIVCKFCDENSGETVKAVVVAPQCDWSEELLRVEWVPACEMCYEGWWDDIPDDKRLPIYRLDGEKIPGDPLFVLLYDTPEGNEEYYAYFSSVERTRKAWSRSFEGEEGYKFVAIAQIVSYEGQKEEDWQ